MTEEKRPGGAADASQAHDLPARTSPFNIMHVFAAFNPTWAAALRLHEHREAWRAQFRPDLSNDPVIRTHDQLWELLFVGKIAFVCIEPPADGGANANHRVRIALKGHTALLPLFFVMAKPIAEDFADCLMRLHRCFIVYGDQWTPEAGQ